ncbi:MAG: hypothetical protein HY303_06115 [Candidatus Wallbacteria bacterium]|nr:hypothetical protein [Candidatus Wallbacteria bacterium]
MKSMMNRVATGLAVMALALSVGTGTASAQYYPAGNYQSWNNYANQAQRNWESRRANYLGPMNSVNRIVYTVSNGISNAVHTVKTTFGNPDYGYYDRFDRTPVVSRGPNPYGGAYAGYGYANGYTAGVNPAYLNRGYGYPSYQTNAYPTVNTAVQYYRATPGYQPNYGGYGVNLFGR